MTEFSQLFLQGLGWNYVLVRVRVRHFVVMVMLFFFFSWPSFLDMYSVMLLYLKMALTLFKF